MKKNIFVFALFLSVFFNININAQSADTFKQEGIASWYGKEYDGRPTASGEIFDSSGLTAAHPSLPFGTRVIVTNQHNNKSVTVRINDRGPFVPARIIDVSRAAAEQLDMIVTGTAPVKIESIDKIAISAPVQAAPVTVVQPAGQALQVVTVQPVQQPVHPVQHPVQQAPQIQLGGQAYPAAQPVDAAPVPVVTVQPATESSLSPYTAPLAAPPTAPPAASALQNPAAQAYAPVEAKLIPAIAVNFGKTYRLQAGSYKNAHNAVSAFDRLKSAGLNPAYERYIDNTNTEYFRVVLSGVRGSDIQLTREKLGLAGFREVLIREEN